MSFLQFDSTRLSIFYVKFFQDPAICMGIGLYIQYS